MIWLRRSGSSVASVIIDRRLCFQNMSQQSKKDCDPSVEQFDRDINRCLERLREIQSMYGDSEGSVREFIDMVEVLHHVEYESPHEGDVEMLRKWISSIEPEKARDLDPSHVEEVVEQFENDVDVLEKMIAKGYFDGVPSAR